ncbi:MAG: flagellar hook protein FlgE [Desulfobacteraceae bacterium]
MALSSALFSGISGLGSLGEAMQVIGDNISNVNTVGFKGSTFTFQDLLSQSIATQAGTSQVGKGTTLSDIYQSFQQGSFETTSSTTDLAIGGDGFFEVRESDSETTFLTRAGNFRFDKEGYLVNPEGYVAQGWQMNEEGEDISSTQDIRLNSFTSAPEESSQVRLICNLNADSNSNHSRLSNAWDAEESPAINSSHYQYQTTIKAYDLEGGTHDITAYFDKADEDQKWEYILTCNPNEDKRDGFADTSSTGLLARGTLTFSESENVINNMTMENLASASGHKQELSDFTFSDSGGITDSNTTVEVENYEALTDDGTGFELVRSGGAWSIDEDAGYTSAQIVDEENDGDDGFGIDLTGDNNADITVSFGETVTDNGRFSFDISGADDTVWEQADINSNGYYTFSPDFIGGNETAMDIEFNPGAYFDGSSFVRDSLTTTQYAKASTTVFQSSDGYGAGDLQGVNVDVDGVITGKYSNGEVIPLYRVAVAKVVNPLGLEKVGGNLYKTTRLSGEAPTYHPGTNGTGNIAPNSLEQSNVDIANEFVKMITTQRGFQANGRIITVTDEMLQELINLKR